MNYSHGRKEKNSSRYRAVRKIDWNLISENSEILQSNIFTQRKVKTTDIHFSVKSAINIFFTQGRDENENIEKGGRG